MIIKYSVSVRLGVTAALAVFVCVPHVAGAVSPGNTHLGTKALSRNTGGYNTAVGFHAMYPNASCTGAGTPASCCTGSGVGSCSNSGPFNNALGETALQSNTTGSHNNAVGAGTLFSNSTGSSNTAVGDSALQFNTTSSNNTAVGDHALFFNTTDNNTAVGAGALETDTTGGGNVALGDNALHNNHTAYSNIAVGKDALANNDDDGSGSAIWNTAVGADSALGANTTGYANTAIGDDTLSSNTTGVGNTAIGLDSSSFGAGDLLTTGSYNIDIANRGVAGESKTIRIGDNQTSTFIAGIKGGNNNGGGQQTVTVDNNGQLGTVVSSRRYKRDIRTMGDASTPLLRLRPVTFRYKPERDPSGETQYGLIAEEVAEVMPNLVIYDVQGRPESVKYQLLDSLLLNEVQKQAQQIEAQTAQLAEQAREMKAQAEHVDALTARLTQLETVVGTQGHTPALQASYQTHDRF